MRPLLGRKGQLAVSKWDSGHKMDGEFPGETLSYAGSSAAERPEGYSRKAKRLSAKTRLRFFEIQDFSYLQFCRK